MSETEATVGTIDVASEETMHSLRRDLGVTSFGINLIALRPRQRNRVHVHERQEEVYLVLEGVLTLRLGDGDLELERGMLARVPPDARAWADWDEPGEGRSPREVPLPEDLGPGE